MEILGSAAAGADRGYRSHINTRRKSSRVRRVGYRLVPGLRKPIVGAFEPPSP
jgi:hypothetical protein